ncbi:MAG: OmpH family outer membrane protein [Maioricimonas sp. JB045]
MKKTFVWIAAVAIVAGTISFSRTTLGQNQGRPAASQGQSEHQVALIDMAHIFKEYTKFKTLREALQEEIKQTDAKAKGMIEQIRTVQEQLTSGQLEEGSPDYVRLESQMLKLQTELESFRKVAQRDFHRREADIYKTVYLEVQDAVQKYASYYKYTVVLRFNRTRVEDAENPQEIIQSMNRQVVYYDTRDDLTDPILSWLNDNYAKTAGRPAAGTTK